MDFLLYNTELMANKISLISSCCYFISKNIIYKKEDIWTNRLEYFTGCTNIEVYSLYYKQEKNKENYASFYDKLNSI